MSSIVVVNQRVLGFIWDPNFHYRFHNSPSFIPTLSRIIPISFLQSHSSEHTLVCYSKLVLTAIYAVLLVFCLKLLLCTSICIFDECCTLPSGIPFLSYRHYISGTVEVINNSIILNNLNRRLLFHMLSKVTREFFKQLLPRKLNNVHYGMLGSNSDWESVILRIMFQCMQDTFLKFTYSINKNTLYRDRVTPSLLLPICNLMSPTTHFVEFV
jgi:hypothetical protein